MSAAIKNHSDETIELDLSISESDLLISLKTFVRGMNKQEM